MKINIIKLWDDLRTSFWFIPMLMAAAAIGLSFAMVSLDRMVGSEWLYSQPWAFAGGAEGATATLSTIASSMITIAGLVFSMTLVALTLASSQLGPRLLRNFMNDKTNQVVLGTFVATFLFALLILRTIQREPEGGFVPHLSVTLAVVLAVAGLCVLVYFIHHVAVSIQADNVAAHIGNELTNSIERLYPEHIGKGADDDDNAKLPERFEQDHRRIASANDGYVQMIDIQGLNNTAASANVTLALSVLPGSFVHPGTELARIMPPARSDTAMTNAVCAAVEIADVQQVGARDLAEARHLRGVGKQPAIHVGEGVRPAGNARFRSLGDGHVDFAAVFSKLSQYGFDGWAVLEWECCIKDSEQGAAEGAPFIAQHIIQVASRAFDDFFRGERRG
jgi:uncharacterized membrane protein